MVCPKSNLQFLKRNRPRMSGKVSWQLKKGWHPKDTSPISLECNGSEAHAARGRDGRQEGRECGYYNLHRYLKGSWGRFY